MVLSKLDKSINYKELKKLNDDDIDYDTNVYSGKLFNKYIEFTIGKPKYFYIEKNVIFFYIYLVNKNSVVLNIGIFEIESSEYSNVIDENGNILFDKLNKSLIFEFVEKYIEKNYTVSINQDALKTEITDKKLDINDEFISKSSNLDSDIQKLKISEKVESDKITLKEETKDDANEEKRIYVNSDSNNWVEKFLNNNNYSIEDNEAGGDCLFAAIRQGLEGTQEKTNVISIRDTLSKLVNDNIYNEYKDRYNMFYQQVLSSQKLLNELSSRYKEIKQILKTTKLKDEQITLISESKNITKQFEALKEENAFSKSFYEDYKYMKNINSIDEFKEYIKKDSTCEDIFWGDSWAVSALEYKLEIKLIILSYKHYRSGDLNGVLQCGEVYKELQDLKTFNPKYYLILDYDGSHYKLVLYKKHKNFQFKEIPYSIKELIVLRCLERQSGPFYLIPEFKNFAKKFNVEEKLLVKDIDIEEPTQLYDPNIVFQYYIKSNGKPKPGKGNGEKIPDEKLKEFSKLSKIDNWRRKLSNLWDENIIIIGGKQWKSVEHFYQANKFKKNNPEYFEQFSLDSDSELSKDPILAKAAGSNTGKAGGKQIRPTNIQIDPDFSKKKDLIMEEALYAKFTQSDELKELIINTKNAKLLNYQVGDKSIVADDIMKIRSKIIS